MITTFEWAGIEFIDNNGGGEGVRFRKLAAPPKHDWSRFEAMSETQRNAAATHDPDAMLLTRADFNRMKRTPQVKGIRRALPSRRKNSPDAFTSPGVLRDWE